ncbi:MAG: hypothetical protein RIG77_09715 [Cyclobacteriaceae bacterium]
MKYCLPLLIWLLNCSPEQETTRVTFNQDFARDQYNLCIGLIGYSGYQPWGAQLHKELEGIKEQFDKFETAADNEELRLKNEIANRIRSIEFESKDVLSAQTNSEIELVELAIYVKYYQFILQNFRLMDTLQMVTFKTDTGYLTTISAGFKVIKPWLIINGKKKAFDHTIFATFQDEDLNSGNNKIQILIPDHSKGDLTFEQEIESR